MKTFRDIEGQSRAITLLQKAYKNNIISHSYLFTGPSGVGKSLIGKIFIKLINCLNVTDDLNPCNKCANCKLIIDSKFIDLIYIKPTSSKDVIKIEQIREIEEKISYKSYSNTTKAVFIESIEQMNISSFNALLKTLEEPPEKTIFILTTSNEDSIPQTIKSRCQNVIFNPLPQNFIYSKLKEVYKEENTENLELISKLAQGSMTNAFYFIEEGIFEARTEFINTLLKDSDFKLADVLKVIHEMVSKYKGESFQVINLLLEFFKIILRDVYLISIGVSENKIINSDYIEEIKKLSKAKTEFIVDLIKKLNILQNNLQSNLNTEMALESYFINFLKGDM